MYFLSQDLPCRIIGHWCWCWVLCRCFDGLFNSFCRLRHDSFWNWFWGNWRFLIVVLRWCSDNWIVAVQIVNHQTSHQDFIIAWNCLIDGQAVKWLVACYWHNLLWGEIVSMKKRGTSRFLASNLGHLNLSLPNSFFSQLQQWLIDFYCFPNTILHPNLPFLQCFQDGVFCLHAYGEGKPIAEGSIVSSHQCHSIGIVWWDPWNLKVVLNITG